MIPVLQRLQDEIQNKAADLKARGWLDQPARGPCVKPWLLTDTAGERYVLPCNDCEPCDRRRLSGWVGRMVCESKSNPFATCETLTYSDDEVLRLFGPEVLIGYPPTKQQLDKEKDRLRKLVQRRDPAAKMFAVAQLGETTSRFHWHALIFWTAPPYNFMPTGQQWHDAMTPPPRREDESRRAYKRRKDKILFAATRGKFYDWGTHGHRIIDAVTPQSAGYCCEYLLGKDKGTLLTCKSQKIGWAHFEQALQSPKRYPMEYCGHYPVEIEQTAGIKTTRWFRMDRPQSAYAKETGYSDRWPDLEVGASYRPNTLLDHRGHIQARKKRDSHLALIKSSRGVAVDEAMHAIRQQTRQGRSANAR